MTFNAFKFNMQTMGLKHFFLRVAHFIWTPDMRTEARKIFEDGLSGLNGDSRHLSPLSNEQLFIDRYVQLFRNIYKALPDIEKPLALETYGLAIIQNASVDWRLINGEGASAYERNLYRALEDAFYAYKNSEEYNMPLNTSQDQTCSPLQHS